MVSLPYSRNKRYLTGIDWVIGALNHLTRASTGAGLSSQVVLELDRPVPEQNLRDRLRNIARAVPALTGRPARDFNLAPYWKIPAHADETALDPTVHHPDSDSMSEDILPCLAAAVNTAFDSESRHLAFHAIHPRSADRTFLAMTFDHRLLDARGAELFLDAVQQNRPPPFHPEPAHLDRWSHRFRAGRHVNRTLAPMSKAPLETIPLHGSTRTRRSMFSLIRFDPDRTGAITAGAEKEAGYLMLMPYVLAVTILQLNAFLAEKGYAHGNFVIPVSMDMRSRDATQQNMLFNHLSFLLLHMTGDAVADRAHAIQSIKRQMYDQTTLGLPRDLCDVTMLMRIAPPRLLAGIISKIRIMLGSFSFSCVGNSAYRSDTFMGARVLNLFHMPRVPTPPGYGFFFNGFNNRLNMVFSYIDGLLTDNESGGLVERISAALAPDGNGVDEPDL